jgi:quinol monooxygenase YgiN
MIYVLATIQVKPDKQAAYLAGARTMIAATRKEDGCIFYDLTQSVTAPNEFTFVERWTTRVALEAHFNTPHMAAWREIGKDCVAGRAIEIITSSHVETL